MFGLWNELFGFPIDNCSYESIECNKTYIPLLNWDKDNEYMWLEELLSNKKKKQTFKSTATKKGEIFVGDLVLVNDLVESKIKTKNK